MTNESLLNWKLFDSIIINESPWSEGHGASPGQIGGGLLYYSIVHFLQAKRCLCIGSGGGFVPRLIRQAQRDLGGEGETHLIDANLPESGWGSPVWLEESSFFRQHFPDIQLHLQRSQEVLPQFPRESFEYIHIDGDHSYEGCRSDFDLALPLLASGGLLTLHDTVLHLRDPRCGVHRVVAELRQNPQFEVFEFPWIGRGIAIARQLPEPPARIKRRWWQKLGWRK